MLKTILIVLSLLASESLASSIRARGIVVDVQPIYRYVHDYSSCYLNNQFTRFKFHDDKFAFSFDFFSDDRCDVASRSIVGYDVIVEMIDGRLYHFRTSMRYSIGENITILPHHRHRW